MIRRGEIWWAELSHPVGSAPGSRHPVVIIQSDDFNSSLINTVIVALVSSNTLLADCPGNVLLPKKSVKLPKDSVVNVSQLLTIDKTLLSAKICTLPQELLYELEDGLRVSLAL